jgi:ribonucleoside-diphosphate reductase alpha chain
VTEFRNEIAETTFQNKYALYEGETWYQRAGAIVNAICGSVPPDYRILMAKEDREQLHQYIADMKFMPGGRYIYYAGREARFYNNCYLLRAEEDTREEWAEIAYRATSCLMTGGGIGVDYSLLRPRGRPLSRTGGVSSGPIPLMHSVNEIGRNVMQGGSRRSAVYASLNWRHEDIPQFLEEKNWSEQIKTMKAEDLNFPAPLDMTNISLNYDDEFLRAVETELPETFLKNVKQAMSTGEPGFSFNFGDKVNDTLRNACTEVTSEDDSDVCNLGSINLSRIESIEELRDVVCLASKFLVCGTLRADLPYGKVYEVRERNRRLGLGLMGIHEWLLKRGKGYEVTDELRDWLSVWRDESERASNEHCDRFFLSRPKAYRAIAPTGTIGILAGTTTGIEPLFAVAYKRRYLTEGTRWKYQYVVDGAAQIMVEEFGVDPSSIESALSLAQDPERRVKFQADVQDYVDMAISSTINLPTWGSKHNNDDSVDGMAILLAKYAPRLRGFTAYPDGSRGGQPMTEMAYEDAIGHKGTEFIEHDICDITGHGGSCGI